MEEPKILEEHQDVPKDFNPEEYFKNAMGITSYKGDAHFIKLRADEVASKYLKSQPIHRSQKIIEETDKGETFFSLKLLLSEELMRTLLSYGGEIEIIEPQKLKELIVHRIKSMQKVYGLR